MGTTVTRKGSLRWRRRVRRYPRRLWCFTRGYHLFASSRVKGTELRAMTCETCALVKWVP